jgi:hypothetical protein
MGKDNLVLGKAMHSQEKPDNAQRRGGKVVWPEDEELDEYEDSPIAYSHQSRSKSSFRLSEMQLL